MASTLSLADIPSNENLMSSPIQLRPFQPGDAEAFRRLNQAWIEKYFGLEDHDNEILNDPEGYVLAQGGHIFFAALGATPIACCALIPTDPGTYEVAKMAVDESLRGQGIGRRLLAYVIDQARSLGAHTLYLESSSRLANAVHLYESLGFRHLPPKPSLYVRANVFMEMKL